MMNHIFLCTSATQLIVYKILCEHLSSKEIPLVEDVLVFVNNPYCNNKCKENIKLYADELAYQDVFFDVNDVMKATSGCKQMCLISRRNISNHELRLLVRYFEPATHYTIEDGVGDYVKENYYNMTTLRYKFRETKALVKKFISLAIKSIFSHSYYLEILRLNFFSGSKIRLSLITKIPHIHEKFCSFYQVSGCKNSNQFKVIVLGSLYDNDRKTNIIFMDKIYSVINANLKQMNVMDNEVLYIPHPRSDVETASYVSDAFRWIIDPSINLAEEAICSFDKAEVWSIGSTSQVYALDILHRSCVVVDTAGLLNHPAIENIAKYLIELGAKKVSL